MFTLLIGAAAAYTLYQLHQLRSETELLRHDVDRMHSHSPITFQQLPPSIPPEVFMQYVTAMHSRNAGAPERAGVIASETGPNNRLIGNLNAETGVLVEDV